MMKAFSIGFLLLGLFWAAGCSDNDKVPAVTGGVTSGNGSSAGANSGNGGGSVGPSFSSLQPIAFTVNNTSLVGLLNGGSVVLVQNGQIASSTQGASPYCKLTVVAGFVSTVPFPVDPNSINDRPYLGGRQIDFTVDHQVAVECFKNAAGAFTLADINGTLGSLARFGN